MNIFDWTALELYAYVLIFFRMLGLMLFAPMFGSEVIPAQVKIAVALVLSLIIFPIAPVKTVNLPGNTVVLILAVLLETGVGVIIGLASMIIFVGAQLAGHFIDQELSLSLANIIDPVTGEQVSIISQFKFIFALMIFIAIEGHFDILRAIVLSYQKVPFLGLSFNNKDILQFADRFFGDIFVIGFKLSAPVIVSVFFATIGLTFLSKAVPEMNFFLIGFSIRIGVGLIIFILSLPVIGVVIEKLYQKSMVIIYRLIPMLAG